MNEPIKLTVEERTEIQNLQEKANQQVYQIGQLYIQKVRVENSLKHLVESEVATTENELNKLIDKFISKYGEGSLNLASGTFIPDKLGSSNV